MLTGSKTQFQVDRMMLLTTACESFIKLESEPLRSKRIFGDHEPRRRRGDFFSPHSTGVADPLRENLGERVNLTFAAMEPRSRRTKQGALRVSSYFYSAALLQSNRGSPEQTDGLKCN